MAKFLFLDYDGVLNSVQQAVALKKNPYNAENLNDVSIGLIRWVCDMTGAKIVVSSTWRNLGVGCLVGIFEAHGWRFPPIVDSTPYLRGKRGEEIEQFLQDYDESEDPLEEYVIIDDDSDMMKHQLNNFVQTDALVGFTLYDALKCVDILGIIKENKQKVNDVRTHVEFKKTKKIDF